GWTKPEAPEAARCREPLRWQKSTRGSRLLRRHGRSKLGCSALYRHAKRFTHCAYLRVQRWRGCRAPPWTFSLWLRTCTSHVPCAATIRAWPFGLRVLAPADARISAAHLAIAAPGSEL